MNFKQGNISQIDNQNMIQIPQVKFILLISQPSYS
jgi:hypothetical protein